MQGWEDIFSTGEKISYLNELLRVGFHTIDFGSFVSPKAIPQMADTSNVAAAIDLAQTPTELLAIVANTRGAEDACKFDSIRYLGFPFSVSETFQHRNANSSVEQALVRVQEIQALCKANQKTLVVYISMGFGNPYGDPYSAEIVWHWVDRLIAEGVTIISLADTVGLATPDQVFNLTDALMRKLPGDVQAGVHLHAAPNDWQEKVDAALEAGCRRFDGALKGIGGCPMSGNELVGNLPMEALIAHLESKGYSTGINMEALSVALMTAGKLFH